MRYALLCLFVCLLAACGGGNTPDNTTADKPFIPDFSTPEGATEAYTYAIETMNLELVGQMVVPAEREVLVGHFRNNFEVSRKENLRWRLEFDKSNYISETAVATMVKFIRLQGESESVLEEAWVVFIQIEDGTWRYSRDHSRKWTAYLQSLEQPQNQPEEKPEEKPDEKPDEEPEGEPEEEPKEEPATDEAYTPDFSTPEGATAAYTRAIETMNLELVGQMVVPAEREAMVENYRNNFELSRKQDLQWRLEFDQSKSMYISETAVATSVKFIRLEGESESVAEEAWVVFIQIEDGTWRYSRDHSRKWTTHLKELEKQDKQPEDRPERAPKEDPAGD